MNTDPASTADRYLDHLTADVDRFADVLDTSPTDAPVAACPGWDVLRLAEHLGMIHRWAEFCSAHARPPTMDDPPIEPIDSERPSDWLRVGAERLVDRLRAIEPDAPTWHPFPVAQVAAVWPRRQAHETAIHRWDAEHAAGRPTTIDTALASDGIDEYFEIAVPRLMIREGISAPEGSLHVHCTDVDGEWLVWADDAGLQVIRAHQKGDAVLRGPAATILLRLWGRDHPSPDMVTIGDEAVLENWLSIAGM